METTKKIVQKMGIVPKLHLATQLTDAKGKKLGVESTGPHRVKFLSDELKNEPDPMTGKDRQVVKFALEENGTKKYWSVPLHDKKGEPNYLLERLMEIEPNEEVILEVRRAGIKNYTSVIRLNQSQEIETDEMSDSEKADELAKALAGEEKPIGESPF